MQENTASNRASDWVDQKSGAIINQPEASSQPYTNVRTSPSGANVIDFQANNNVLVNQSIDHPEFNFSTHLTAIVDTMGNDSQSLFSTQSNGISRDYQLSGGVSGEYRFRSQSNGIGPIISPVTDFKGAWRLFNSEGNWGTSTRNQWVDGVVVGTAAYSSEMVIDQQFKVGANRNEVRKIDGAMACLIITASVSQEIRELYEGWQAWNFGLVANLAVAHPYKTDGSIFGF